MTSQRTRPARPGRTRAPRAGRTGLRAAPTAALLATVLLSGCSAAADQGGGGTPTPAPSATVTPSPAPTAAAPSDPAHAHAAAPLPGAHVHGAGINPADGRLYLATHEGLYRYEGEGPVAVGPVIDLMGFTVAGPDHFYASGHPGPGVDLPNPVGLIESTDGGQTWTPVSRQGRTDFHAMVAAGTGVVGFDGAALLSTTDGVTWSELRVPVPVYAVAASPDGTTLVVTSPEGPVRSADAGATWAGLHGPLLQQVAFADDTTAVGVTPDGAVLLSEDAGATWTERGSVGGPPQAVAAVRTADGAVEVVVATADALVRSVGGAPFAPVVAG